MPERLVTGFYPVPALFHLFVDDHVHTHTPESSVELQ